ncbi:MAG: ankyrin repeat domain-containing protein [Candidatus Margulisbacteria bacterium]|nr:ankyrin repeat domain-containing protein [Candidatus Margulisiibacteriota bacterium]
MAHKLVSFDYLEKVLVNFLNEQKKILDNNINIFSGSQSKDVIHQFLLMKMSGIDYIVVLAKTKNLEFLRSEHRSETDSSDIKSKARTAIYFCLRKLNQENADKVLKQLAKSFELLGYKNKVYVPIKRGYLGKEIRSAIMKREYGKIRDYLKAGADIHDKNSRGRTALHEALRVFRTEIVEELINLGADLEMPDDLGETAIHYAAIYGRRETLSKLVLAGADINKKNLRGNTAFLEVIRVSGMKKIVEKLISLGAKVDIADKEGNYALTFAAYDNNCYLLKLLIKAGANLNVQDGKGMTALMLAARSGYQDIVQILVNNGVDIFLKNKEGQTAQDIIKDELNYFKKQYKKKKISVEDFNKWNKKIEEIIRLLNTATDKSPGN